ncbi:uncharacterized protein B0H18DRAFT_402981 [Fomitopsis serialis]|uniref:uncharacterized protein n=1 Tax=Fomitopsis serialis TaxID=139415 RepID=UPI002007380B|nr:uncharacterized protein B0H18DRAFT_402981 [Neoantrodia serialis]KAH9924807.1 hypothetical protein B0H18DRAFT_402981 [Neoantrodia serialis]
MNWHMNCRLLLSARLACTVLAIQPCQIVTSSYMLPSVFRRAIIRAGKTPPQASRLPRVSDMCNSESRRGNAGSRQRPFPTGAYLYRDAGQAFRIKPPASTYSPLRPGSMSQGMGYALDHRLSVAKVSQKVTHMNSSCTWCGAAGTCLYPSRTFISASCWPYRRMRAWTPSPPSRLLSLLAGYGIH